jgi:multiple antibiotic resistance protein
MMELFAAAFVSFFVVINPAGVAITFAAMTADASPGWRRAMAFRAVLVATLVLAGFGFGGEMLLSQLGVTFDAFRIAGGALLFLIAVDMLFERRAARRAETAIAVNEARAKGEMDDISVFPLAIPLIAGPGAIATVMLYLTEHRAPGDQAVVLSAAGLSLLLCLVAFLMAAQVQRLVGATAAAVVTRVFGILLAALAAQFVVDGISGAFGLSTATMALAQGR